MQKQKRGMLEYAKLILDKVSFDATLFEKELLKAIDQLLGDEVAELIKWCEKNYNALFQRIKAHGVIPLPAC